MHRLSALFLTIGLAACTLTPPAVTETARPATATATPQITATAKATAEVAPKAPQSAPAAPPPSAPSTPAAPTPAALDCLAKDGIWSPTGTASVFTCLQPTPDANTSCRRQSDCEGLCLARSRTCAPVKPLFGCNPILQDDGTEAILCLD